MNNSIIDADEIFMQRALDIALLGVGQVSPNPCVGCVIVANGKIIGEGWHQQYGGPHAEVNAVAAVTDKRLLKEATVYVTLEPCSHYGKTPPCADLLIRSGVKKVVISTVDSNPLVGGTGIQKLLNANIEVVTAVLEKKGREINDSFFTFIEKRRPFILLKWAQTADRFIAREDLSSKWISNEFSRRLVHQWRSQVDGVLVGTTTAAFDNPALSVRDWTGRNPLRIVMDRYLKLPPNLKIFDRRQKTFCYNTVRDEELDNLHYIQLPEKYFLEQLVADLYKKNIQSIMVEGGRQTLDLFIKSGLWDEARIFTSLNSFGEGVEAPILRGDLKSKDMLMDDSLEIFTPWKK